MTHAGRYDSLKKAESYAKYLRSIGNTVDIKEVICYDVIVGDRDDQ